MRLAALFLAILAGAGAFAARITPQIPPALTGLGGALPLTTATGALPLSALRGKVVLLYFGYAHCPDACPTALATIARALDRLDPARSVGMFVSLDPARDTPRALARYARFFHPRIVAGTIPDSAALQAAAARFRVAFHYETPSGRPDPNGDYAVDHTSFIYLITPDGRVAMMFDFRDDPAEIVAWARAWLFARRDR